MIGIRRSYATLNFTAGFPQGLTQAMTGSGCFYGIRRMYMVEFLLLPLEKLQICYYKSCKQILASSCFSSTVRVWSSLSCDLLYVCYIYVVISDAKMNGKCPALWILVLCRVELCLNPFEEAC